MRLRSVLAFLCASCSALDSGPDSVELLTEPPGATVRIRSGRDVRVMPGTTPMTIRVERTLPDPLEIEFSLDGFTPQSRTLWMQKTRGAHVLPRDEWKWPEETISVQLLRSPRT
jgi:hypothetical protein